LYLILKKFALFLDDSGSAKPNPDDKTPYFAMGGVLVRRQDESMIKLQVEEFRFFRTCRVKLNKKQTIIAD
jgi:hypothetical protein